MATPVVVSPGKDYWLGLIADNGTASFGRAGPIAAIMVVLRFAHVSFLVAFVAALSLRGSVSASTGVVLPVPPAISAPSLRA